jgi:hypothetical protein
MKKKDIVTLEETGESILFSHKERTESAKELLKASEENREEERKHRSKKRKDWDILIF